jgi:glutamyl-tRNA synthetase
VEWVDGFCGRSAADVHRDVGDFVVARRDRVPAYQLAVVVDDAAEGVTEVHRGADLLPSAARQWHLRQALGLPAAIGYHLPLVLDEAGRRLAKRSDDLSLAELRRGGTDPRAIVGWVARTAGMEAAERASPREGVGVFRMEQVPGSPVVLAAQDVESLRKAR